MGLAPHHALPQAVPVDLGGWTPQQYTLQCVLGQLGGGVATCRCGRGQAREPGVVLQSCKQGDSIMLLLHFTWHLLGMQEPR